MVFNEYYRDQDLVTELTIDTTSGADTTTNTSLQKISWEKIILLLLVLGHKKVLM